MEKRDGRGENGVNLGWAWNMHRRVHLHTIFRLFFFLFFISTIQYRSLILFPLISRVLYIPRTRTILISFHIVIHRECAYRMRLSNSARALNFTTTLFLPTLANSPRNTRDSGVVPMVYSSAFKFKVSRPAEMPCVRLRRKKKSPKIRSHETQKITAK